MHQSVDEQETPKYLLYIPTIILKYLHLMTKYILFFGNFCL